VYIVYIYVAGHFHEGVHVWSVFSLYLHVSRTTKSCGRILTKFYRWILLETKKNGLSFDSHPYHIPDLGPRYRLQQCC